MALDGSSGPDSPLVDLRRRGQFLFGVLLWASAGGLLIVLCGSALVAYHYAISLADRVRLGFGFAPPLHGPDWFLLIALSSVPLIALLALVLFVRWYGRLWLRRVALVWPNSRERRQLSRWQHPALHLTDSKRHQRAGYIASLLQSPAWSNRSCPRSQDDYEGQAEWLLQELEKDIAERALATGLTVGISHNRYIDLFTIFAAALEVQLHVLSRLGKRPSAYAWRLLIQRCGASLFINSYLNRQDSIALNLMIKKAGMGLKASGDLMDSASQHLADVDFDLDEALNVQHSGILGMATKSLELGATMALTVGQVGLHILGTLIESVGDELTQGALAAGILYYHGMALASDTLALDAAHRASPGMNRSFREGVWKMGEIAGSILRDLVRQRRTVFRDRRSQIIRSLPKSAYARIQSLFGRGTPASPQTDQVT
ncbi:MAG: hypothetical protein JO138_16585 [Acidobacteriaceae bacterium]|nr:hypothetical protein [Acidobacteriaceae bacterium]